MRRVIVMGAAGRDFHNFNVRYREDEDVEVVAFTATQIPGIADRVYPASLAGPRYPDGIPVWPEEELPDLVRRLAVDEVVFAYSDVSHEHVMHQGSRVLAAGADFTLLGPRSTMLESDGPWSRCARRSERVKSRTTRGGERCGTTSARHSLDIVPSDELFKCRFLIADMAVDAIDPSGHRRHSRRSRAAGAAGHAIQATYEW